MNRFKVKFFIHHKSGKIMYGDIETFTGETGDIFSEINNRVAYLQKRINKKFTYDIILREKIDDDTKVEEDTYEIQTKSKEMSAEDAIKFIKDKSFEYLEEGKFISDNEDRITVKDAYEKKRKQQEQT